MAYHQVLVVLTWTIPCISFFIYIAVGQPNEASNRLSVDIRKNYNKMIRGVQDMREVTYLYFWFNLIRIAEFDEVNGKLSVVGYFEIFWNDYRMRWEPAEYNYTNKILFKEKEVWRPLIVLVTPQDKFKILGDNDNFVIRYNPRGRAEWYPGDIWASSCTPDMYKYPFDTQSCLISFTIWDYDINEVQFIALSDKISLHVYSSHGMWDLIETSMQVDIDRELNLTLIDITLILKRISTFHIVNMILPIVFVGLLNILVFLLPALSGERVGYSITVLLAIAVFQTIAFEKLPSVSKPNLPLLCIKLLTDLILSALVMTFTIMTLYFYHMPESRNVPSGVACVTRFVLCKTCCRSNVNDTVKDKYYKYTIRNGIGITEYVSDSDYHQTEVTWTDVGKSSDIVFAVFSLLAFISSNGVFFVCVAF
ncbi:neuronal acetylcholine receptor subunit alpha-3-like [Saccostrea echinata]|uniref:neuronal acetylcholine receptor subunit alpha-3-like n=1 Tax=Saccostrea echinata TaxID=191078 RepID=UPI002A80A8B1|nr:neuronal acetylcholine receptor subunit alpha-3-like [Saccostrea echinata]